MKSFSTAIDMSIKEKVDMVLIAGDLFDSAYPSIEILKKTFSEFRKLNNSEIPCFIVAGSHDYSVSGKTFLDVLEHAGFCKNVYNFEDKNGKIFLQPTIYKNYAIYGYPGKKSSLEIPELKNIEIQDSPGFLKIFMLHTSIKEAVGTLPIESIKISELPKADYYALGHLHIDFCKDNVVYSGPIFPNNFEELEELNYGQFYIVDYSDIIRPVKKPIRLKEVLSVQIQIDNTLTATEKIISELRNYLIEDKIVLLKLKGKLSQGKISDINFDEIEKFVKNQKAYVFVKNISGLSVEDSKMYIEVKDMHKVEETMIEEILKEKSSKFNNYLSMMLKSLNIEKQEGETNQVFQERLIDEMKKTLNFKED